MSMTADAQRFFSDVRYLPESFARSVAAPCEGKTNNQKSKREVCEAGFRVW
jgi:hypothetical protein